MKDYKSLLKEFVSFKSISTDDQYKSEIEKTVNWLNDLFTDHGFESTVVYDYDNPIIVSSYVVDESFETCLVYGHYDVQPADISDGWDSEPFELSERNNRLYARGVIDNKGQVLVHIYNVLKLIEENKLRYNVKFILEGNEETGSPNLHKFLTEKKELLKSDFALISDGELTMGHPSIEVGFRGVFNNTITIKTSGKDLHSGLYGGVSPNAARELVKVLDTLVDDNNKITIDNFYDSVEDIDDETIDANNNIPFSYEEYKEVTGTKALVTEPGWEFYNQLAFRPSLDITGIETGYMGEGYKNAIPGEASAKVSFRITAHQKPEECAELLQKYVQKIVPEYVEATVLSEQMSEGVVIDNTNDYIERAEDILEEAYGKNVLFKYCGASLPIVTDFNNILKMPQAIVPLINEDCNMHGANENFDLDVLEKAMTFSYNFFKSD